MTRSAFSGVGRNGRARTYGALVLGAGVAVGPAVALAPVAAADIMVGTCTIVSSPTPMVHTVCPNANLDGANLAGQDLSFAELTGASLIATDLTGANLTESDLTNAVLGQDVGITLVDNANLTDATFTGTLLSPGTQNAAADSGGTATVSWADPATTFGYPVTFGPCTPASGSVFSVGTVSVTCAVTGGAGGPGTLAFDVVVDPFGDAPTISGSPTAATVGVAYNFAFTVAGNPAPTVSTTDTLPAGLTLSPAGVLSGTPTVAGSFPITVTAANGVTPDATASVTLVVDEAAGGGSLENLFGS